MAYKKLSEQVTELSNVQRSDAFVKAFREGVRTGDISAIYVPGRFTLPKTFNRRGTEDTYSRDTRDMLFEVTPAFEEWFTNINRELAPSRQGGKVKVTTANIEAGLIDFKALAEETRRKMHSSFSKGQALGSSRKGAASRGKAGTSKAAPKKVGRPKKS